MECVEICAQFFLSLVHHFGGGWPTLSPSPYFPFEAFIPLRGMITPLTLTVQYRFVSGWVFRGLGSGARSFPGCGKGRGFGPVFRSRFSAFFS